MGSASTPPAREDSTVVGVIEKNGSTRAKLSKLIAGLDDEQVADLLFQVTKGEHGQIVPLAIRESGRRRVRVTRASDIKVRPVRFAWKDRAPVGTLGLIGGREGIGKSLFVYTLAAALTRGRLPGAYYGTPRTVVISATEDSKTHVIVPRLIAAGADLDRVIFVEAETAEGFDTEISLPVDLPALKEVLLATEAAMLVLDPLVSRLESSLDTHKDAEVRRALEPLVRMIEETKAVAFGLIHVNKTASADPLTLLMGSRAFAAVARFVLFLMVDPEDEQVRLVGQPKNNYGRTDLPTLTFRIVNALVAETEEGPVYTGKLEWSGESDRNIREVLASTDSDGAASSVGECAAWLQDYLQGEGGRAPSKQIKAAARDAGYTVSTLHRARERLHARTVSEGFPRQTWWKLPSRSTSRLNVGETDTTETTGTTDLSRPGRLSRSSGGIPPARVERPEGATA